MTVEEIEIIVTAKVEEALKEFMKIVPAIKESMKQAQEAFSKVDTKTMTNKLHQAVNFMKKKMQDFKKSTENNEIAIKVTNKDAQRQITQVQKQIESLQEKINARQIKLNVINPQIDKIVEDTKTSVTPKGISPNDKAMDTVVNNTLSSNKDFTSLNSKAQKLYTEIEMYNKQLNEAKSKMKELEQNTSRTATSQNRLTSFFSVFKQKIEQVKPTISSIVSNFKGLPKITQRITNYIKGMGSGLKQGFGHLLKYAGALFSLRGIYSVLSNSASSWLSSQNAGAKQLSANIEYMKHAMGSTFAPIIEYVISLIYQLMKAIQSVVYAFSGINIFAKATASSMKGTEKSAKQTSKSLSSVHSEISNVSDNKDNGGNGEIAPSMDLSELDGQMSPFAQKLYDFFKPLKESWDTYGGELIAQLEVTVSQVGGLISSVWKSFENIITNGTVYSIFQNILAIIGNIAEAFEKAWNYNGNGDAIVQNLANAFNNLLGAINNVVKSEGFQEWLKNCSEKFKQITDKISEIDWQPLVNALTTIGKSVGTIALDILSGLVDIFKWLVENPIVPEVLLAIAIAIGILSGAITIITTAYTIWTSATEALAIVSGLLNISMLPLIAIIIAIIAVIALIVLAIMNWDTIMKALADTWNWICEQAQIIWNAISEFFTNLWQGICDIFNNVGQWFSDKFTEAYNFIINIFNGIGQWFLDRWNDICNVFSGVGNWFSNMFSNAWQGIMNAFSGASNFFSGVWQGICNVFGNVGKWFGDIFSGAWQAVQNVFNAGGKIFQGIKDGIFSTFKNIVNSLISGINAVVAIPFNAINSALRFIKNVNIMGFKPFEWLPTIGVPQIPKLAKGGVLTEATALIAGEYSGAKSNPEIVTPQNIMYDTMKRAISDSDMGNSDNDRPIYLNVYVGNKKIGEILLEDLRDKKRQTGKNVEALIGG